MCPSRFSVVAWGILGLDACPEAPTKAWAWGNLEGRRGGASCRAGGRGGRFCRNGRLLLPAGVGAGAIPERGSKAWLPSSLRSSSRPSEHQATVFFFLAKPRLGSLIVKKVCFFAILCIPELFQCCLPCARARAFSDEESRENFPNRLLPRQRPIRSGGKVI